jgi:hypothetical protein
MGGIEAVRGGGRRSHDLPRTVGHRPRRILIGVLRIDGSGRAERVDR